MSEFLDHHALGPKIREVMSGSKVRCAVAFWGNGATDHLFPDGIRPLDAQIICDLSMGGSNPKEIRKLGAPDISEVRYVQGLHSKIYISDKGLIVCSANASNNGIGFLAVAQLIEAGVFYHPTAAAYEMACVWFSDLWEKAKVVDEPALIQAELAWKRRPPTKINPPPANGTDLLSLFDTVAGDPERFRGVGFAFAQGGARESDRDEAAEAMREEDDNRPVPIISQEQRSVLPNWPLRHVFSNWSKDDISAWPERFVCVYLGSGGRLSYVFYKREFTALLEGTRGMVFATPNGSLRKELGFKHSSKLMSQNDEDRARSIFKELEGGTSWLIESGEKLADLLYRSAQDPGSN